MQKSLLTGVTILLVSIFSVSCIIMPANGALTWTIETVNEGESAGVGCALALDNFGTPWISYGGADNQLKLVHYTGTTWEKSVVDTTGDTRTAIAMNKAGNPAIAYQDSTNGRVEYAEQVGTIWQISTVDDECQVVPDLSLVIDSTGNPHIAYIDFSDMDLPLLKYASRVGSTWSVEVIPVNCLGQETVSLQLDSASNPCISYYDVTSKALLYIHKVGGSWLPETVDSTGGHMPSLKLRSDGQPGISYYKTTSTTYQLYYAHRESGVWYPQLVDSDGCIGSYSSLAFDYSNFPHIAYYDVGNKGLKYAYYDGTSWHVEAVDFTDEVGQFASLALDSSGNPYICYNNEMKAQLKYAHVANMVKLPSVTPEANGAGVLLFSVLAAVGCYIGIKRKTT